MHIYNELKGVDYEIIVVNDHKTNIVEIPQLLAENITCYNNPKSGVASARNYGAKLAKGIWLLFLDDDMILFRKNINSYSSYFGNKDNICVNIDWEYPPEVIEDIKKNAFGRFLIQYGFTTLRGWNNYPNWPIDSSIEVSSVASPNLLIKKSDFVDSGGYDENFPFAGFEDYAFSKRLESKKFKMFVDTSSIMYHNEEDRLEMNSWLLRKERGGVTRKIAVEYGFGEIEINYNPLKKIVYSCNPVLIPILKFLVKCISRFGILDPISFACYKMLLGIYIYKGYNK
jgi:GT2 family glycosyltransferase